SKTKEFKPINVQDNIWHYSFGELPTHYQGSKVKYSVKEIDVPQGYQVTEQGLDLINTHQVKQPKKQKTLPSTGQKTTMSGLVGIVLMIISWGLGYRIRKKV
ncbi:Cna B-type domain-containing protein, partial [Ligilactobacillus ceti]